MGRLDYGQEPKRFRDGYGLIRILTDINGNKFDAGEREVGSEIVIDYLTSPLTKATYDVVLDKNTSVKCWIIRGKKEVWVADTKYGLGGEWVDEDKSE